MRIWLDDQLDNPEYPERSTPEGWVGAKNFKEFKRLIGAALAKGEKIEAINYDNDISKEHIEELRGEEEGWRMARWLNEKHQDIFLSKPELEIHSANPAGRKRLEGEIDEALNRTKELIEAKDRPSPWAELDNPR